MTAKESLDAKQHLGSHDVQSGKKDSSQDSDGWTRVPAKGRRRGGRSRPSAAPVAIGHSPGLPRTENLRSASDIADEYRRIRAQWETTEASQILRRFVTDHGPASVSTAVCLGIGTFDPPDGGWDTKRRTYVQLIAFLLVVEAFEGKLGRKIECVFQEPVFTEPDKAFITSLGHQAVDSPQGFDMVKPGTLLFGVHLYRPIYAKALESCLPAVFIGTDLDVWDTVSLGDSDDLVNGQVMEKTYGKMKCPQDTSTTAFSGTCIYWRKSDGDEIVSKDSLGTEDLAVAASPRDATDEGELARVLESVTLG